MPRWIKFNQIQTFLLLHLISFSSLAVRGLGFIWQASFFTWVRSLTLRLHLDDDFTMLKTVIASSVSVMWHDCLVDCSWHHVQFWLYWFIPPHHITLSTGYFGLSASIWRQCLCYLSFELCRTLRCMSLHVCLCEGTCLNFLPGNPLLLILLSFHAWCRYFCVGELYHMNKL
jgi:hypothetical protein